MMPIVGLLLLQLYQSFFQFFFIRNSFFSVYTFNTVYSFLYQIYYNQSQTKQNFLCDYVLSLSTHTHTHTQTHKHKRTHNPHNSLVSRIYAPPLNSHFHSYFFTNNLILYTSVPAYSHTVCPGFPPPPSSPSWMHAHIVVHASPCSKHLSFTDASPPSSHL